MADSNLPPEQPPPKPRKKKLPPLKGDEEEEGAAPARARKPRRKAQASAEAEAEGADAAVPANPRHRKELPAPPSTEDSPDHAAGPVSSEHQLLQPAEATGRPQKRKKKKKSRPAPPQDGQVEEARRSPEGQEESAVRAEASSPSRTRYIDVEGMPLAKVLETVRDDVVTKGEGRVNLGADLQEDEKTDEGILDDDPTKLAGQAGGDSNLSDTIFRQTQNTRAFKAEKIEKYQQRVDQERRERELYLQGVVEEDTSNRTLKCAIGFTKIYNYIGTLLIGLFAGFSLFHNVSVWTSGTTYLDFLESYSLFSTVSPIVYYVVLTLIIISVLDRYDTGKVDSKSCLECVSFRHAGMVVLLFFPAYLVSNAMYPTDMWIRGYSQNRTAYASLDFGEAAVQGWRIMDTVRAACLVLGWFVVAFNTRFNKLAINLESELDDLIGDESVEMGGTKA